MLIGHGGNVYRAARAIGCSPEEILDFSSNVNPLPLKDEFLRYLERHLYSIQYLPEPDSRELREKLASRYGISYENILIGPGTTQWIYDLPIILDIGRVVIPIPTYADYEDAAHLASRQVQNWGPFPLMNQWGPLFSQMVKRLKPHDLIFLCNPNNPTGQFMPPKMLKEVISSRPDCTWCIDESYAPFIGRDEDSSLIPMGIPKNCLVLRSFSKIYGIPGLRLGAIFGDTPIIDRLFKCQRPWAVARITQLAGTFLIDRPEWESETREYLTKEKAYLIDALKQLPHLHPIESNTHFFLVRLSPPLKVAELSESLLQQRILIRDCENFKGMEGTNLFRISPRTRAENEHLIKVLKDMALRLHGRYN